MKRREIRSKKGAQLNVIKLRRSLQMNKESNLQAFLSQQIDRHDEKAS
jgi:hypothetical protein